jgi:flagellar biosynthesis protein FlhA
MEGEWESRFRVMSRHTDAVLAIGVIGLVLLLIIPLPPLCLDALLSISIVLSVMVLLLTLYVENALEFSAFPSVLLFLTLFRLGLNIASTRMILTQAEAGDIIRTFGEFVIQGNEVVGLILFILLTIINFIVVTKGAGRIAEVAARFTLEALPGKQMAIDSELSSGLISHSQAKEERKKLRHETDFYGAMDGASKFVKGDAVAGLIITGVNIAGGLMTGIVMKGLNLQQCWTTMTRLTIGDGLVTQIPALLVSIGAAMMVTRASSGSLGKMVPQQIFHQPKVLLITGTLLLLISFIPGMPLFLMLPLSALLFLGGFFQLKTQVKRQEVPEEKQGISFLVAPLEVQLGYQVVLYAQPLQDRLKEIREQILSHLGIHVCSVHISDQVDLPPTGWAILVKGVKVASGRDAELHLLVQRLIEVIESHAHELINRQDVAQMLQAAKSYDNAVVDELYPKKLCLGQILKVLQHLLKERIPIRDFVTILEILADHAVGEKSDVDALTEEVRQGLAGKISEEFFGKTRQGHVITIDPKVEQMLTASKGGLRPKAIDQLAQKLLQLHEKGKRKGVKAVVLTTASNRVQLKRLIEKRLPELPVLSYKEVAPDVELTSLGEVSNEVLI